MSNLNHPFNAPFCVMAKTLKIVTSSAMEIEVASAFYNVRDGLPFRTTLQKLGHPQPLPRLKWTTKQQLVF